MKYEFEHSVNARAALDDAWEFWTNVDNWMLDPAIESIEIDGPFEKGARGLTRTVEGQRIEWTLEEVGQHNTATIEIPMPGAVGRFHWRFVGLGDGEVMITQRITLSGVRADDYLPMMNESFEQGIREGMTRLASELTHEAFTTTNPSSRFS